MTYKPYKLNQVKLQTFNLTDKPKMKKSVKVNKIKTISPFWDSDKDGVPNFLDCQPFNPEKQDFEGFKKKVKGFAVSIKKKVKPVAEEFKKRGEVVGKDIYYGFKKKAKPVVAELEKRGKVAGKEVYFGLTKKAPEALEKHAVEMGWVGPKKPKMKWDEELGEWVEVTPPGYTVGPGIRESVREGMKIRPGAIEELREIPVEASRVIEQVGEMASSDMYQPPPPEPGTAYPPRAQQKRPWYPYQPVTRQQSFFRGFGNMYRPVTYEQSFFKGHPTDFHKETEIRSEQELLRRKKKDDY